MHEQDTIGVSTSDDDCVESPVAGAVVSNFRDTTERQAAQRALAASELRYRRIVETTSEGVWMVDGEGRTTFANARMAEMLGCTVEELIGASPLEYMDEEARGIARAATARRRAGAADSYEQKFRRKDGSDLWVSLQATPLIDADGRYEGAFAMALDISTRRRAEAERNHLASIVESSEDAIIGKTLDGRITSWNRSAEKLYGYSAAEAIGRSIEMLVPPDRRDELAYNLARLKAGEQVAPYDTVRVRKDGSPIDVSLVIWPIRNARGEAIAAAAIARDLSERKRVQAALRRSEECLRQAQKLEAIGLLAGGVAHDFNNTLSVILTCGSLALEELPPDSPVREDIEEITRAAERATNLTRQLLLFSRQHVLQPQVIDLNQILRDVQRMLRRILGEDVHLILSTSERPHTIHADPTQLEQVIMNLIVNARDAMPAGGQLRIETGEAMLEAASTPEFPEVRAGRYVTLTVTDTGVGMDAATRERIFEPFFTTKEKGRGTGLGLTLVFSLVQQSGGKISVDSAPGKGSTFKLFFPKASDRDMTGTLSIDLPSQRAALRGSETVLLVEDDDAVRTATRRVLAGYGYNVLEAGNGGEAFLICEEYRGEIDLLIADVVMPRMSGPQLARRLGLLRPKMKVLFMSGYTDNAITPHGLLESGAPLLQKPVAPDVLLRKVRLTLDAAR